MKKRVTKTAIIAGGCFLVIAAAVFLVKPSDTGGGYDAYFGAMNATLKSGSVSRPVILLDLDRIDGNMKRVLRVIRPPLKYRIVMKSLPSPDLLEYVMTKAGTRRLMPFHLSHMRELLERGATGLDMLPGRPFPAAAAEEFYASLPAHLRSEAVRGTQWLVDSEHRLREYLGFAARHGITIRVNLEIDVGLHRGGARTNGELASMLAIISQNPGRLVFSGLMGYDGHVAHVPFYIGSRESAIRREFGRVMDRYSGFIEFGKEKFPSLFRGELTFNGGGSSTYALYDASLPVNDVAAGSCLVMPSTFDVFTLKEHRPALFIAAPVLKKIDGFGVPFIEALHPLIECWDPNAAFTFYVSGGGWSDAVLAPAGVSVNTLTASPPNENMLPTQSMLNGSENVRLTAGDFVFYHPMQGDAIMQFDGIVVLREGRIQELWRPFASRI